MASAANAVGSIANPANIVRVVGGWEPIPGSAASFILLARVTRPKQLDTSYLSLSDPLDVGFKSEGFRLLVHLILALIEIVSQWYLVPYCVKVRLNEKLVKKDVSPAQTNSVLY